METKTEHTPKQNNFYSKSTFSGYRKPLIGEYGEKICVCTKPLQSIFPDNKIICLRCWGEWSH